MAIKPERLQILLAEYQACNMNRDHYDSVRWLIGSVFIGASLTAFGLSSTYAEGPLVLIIALFSQSLVAIFIGYNDIVQAYIDLSLERCREIEIELRKFKAPVLHSRIDKRTRKRRGRLLTKLLVGITTSAWILRILLLSLKAQFGIAAALTVILVLILGVVLVCYIENGTHGYVKKTARKRTTQNEP